jgi:hypothetical protein
MLPDFSDQRGILILMGRNTPLYIVAQYIATVANATPTLSGNLLQ